MSFNNYNRKERVPYVVYADLECILEKTKTEKTSKYKYQYHRVFSISQNLLKKIIFLKKGKKRD